MAKQPPASVTIERQLEKLNQDLAALRTDLPELKNTLQRREEALRTVRRQKQNAAALEELAKSRNAVAAILTSHQEDMREVAEEIRRLTSDLDRARKEERLEEARLELKKAEAEHARLAHQVVRNIVKELQNLTLFEGHVATLRDEVRDLRDTLSINLPSIPSNRFLLDRSLARAGLELNAKEKGFLHLLDEFKRSIWCLPRHTPLELEQVAGALGD